jgi:flagellar motility protein MotE (MotC chaperone)
MAGHGRWLLVAGGLLTAVAGWAAVDNPTRLHRTTNPQAVALEDLSSDLDARERSLDRREQSVVERERELRAIEERLKERTTQLETLRTEIDGLRVEVDDAHRARVAMVVKSVEAMKPAAAAAMIAELDRALAIEVIQTMNKSKAGKMLAQLPPAESARLTEGMAGAGGPVGTRTTPKPAGAGSGTEKP